MDRPKDDNDEDDGYGDARSESLAPLAEQSYGGLRQTANGTPNRHGVLRVNTSEIKIPGGIESDELPRNPWRMDPVILIAVLCALVWVAGIAIWIATH